MNHRMRNQNTAILTGQGLTAVILVLACLSVCVAGSSLRKRAVPHYPQRTTHRTSRGTTAGDISVNHIKAECPVGQLLQTSGNKSLCCQPVLCDKEYEIETCNEAGGRDRCVPCRQGYQQPNPVSSFNIGDTSCFRIRLSRFNRSVCPLDDTKPARVKPVNCAMYCECKTERCYVGIPCGCTRVKPCGPNEQLNKTTHKCEPCPKYSYKNYIGCGPCTYNLTSFSLGLTSPPPVQTSTSTYQKTSTVPYPVANTSQHHVPTVKRHPEEDDDDNIKKDDGMLIGVIAAFVLTIVAVLFITWFCRNRQWIQCCGIFYLYNNSAGNSSSTNLQDSVSERTDTDHRLTVICENQGELDPSMQPLLSQTTNDGAGSPDSGFGSHRDIPGSKRHPLDTASTDTSGSDKSGSSNSITDSNASRKPSDTSIPVDSNASRTTSDNSHSVDHQSRPELEIEIEEGDREETFRKTSDLQESINHTSNAGVSSESMRCLSLSLTQSILVRDSRQEPEVSRPGQEDSRQGSEDSRQEPEDSRKVEVKVQQSVANRPNMVTTGTDVPSISYQGANVTGRNKQATTTEKPIATVSPFIPNYDRQSSASQSIASYPPIEGVSSIANMEDFDSGNIFSSEVRSCQTGSSEISSGPKAIPWQESSIHETDRKGFFPSEETHKKCVYNPRSDLDRTYVKEVQCLSSDNDECLSDNTSDIKYEKLSNGMNEMKPRDGSSLPDNPPKMERETSADASVQIDGILSSGESLASGSSVEISLSEPECRSADNSVEIPFDCDGLREPASGASDSQSTVILSLSDREMGDGEFSMEDENHGSESEDNED